MKHIRDGPLARAVGAREVALVEREALQRLVSSPFELLNKGHASQGCFGTR